MGALNKTLFINRGVNPDGTDETGNIPNNPSGKEFLDSVKSSIGKTVDKYSVTVNSLEKHYSPFTPGGGGGYRNPPEGNFVDVTGDENNEETSGLGLAIPVDTNKMSRVQSYGNIARYPELDWCINEIASDFLHEDIEGDYLKLKFRCLDSKFTDGEDTIIQEEFKNLVANYDLRTNGYNMIRKFLIEGEICFENVIDPNHPEYGIIGEKYIPSMFYDFLRNQKTGEVEGLYLDPARIQDYAQFGIYGGNSSYHGQSTTYFNAIRQVPAMSYQYSMDMKDKVVFPFEQVTYMNSGITSEDGSIIFPIIEKAVVPTRQLLLLHDAMIILRITRAPEKLVFNVDLTGMPQKRAQEYARRLVQDRKTKKAVQGSGHVTNVYNAETMLDAYYFWKTAGNGGTTVSNLDSNIHYNELNDVEYFLKRILKFLHIPWARWAENAVNRQDEKSISNEEYSFAQFIVRIQTLFAAAVKKTFITHLRLRGLYEKYDLHESDFDVVMVPPSLFETYKATTKFNDTLQVLAALPNIPFLSKNILMKKLLNMTDTEIKENSVESRREALFDAQTEFMKAKVGETGKVWLDVEKYLPQPQEPQEGGEQPNEMANAENSIFNDDSGEDMDTSSLDPKNKKEHANEFDDSDRSYEELDTEENPEYGDFADKREEHTDNRTLDRYPENDMDMKYMRQGKNPTLTDVYNDVFGKSFNTRRSLGSTFYSNFGDIDSKRSLQSVFDTEFGTKKDYIRRKRELPSREEDQEIENKSLTDVFNDEFKGYNIKKFPKEEEPKETLSDVFDQIFKSTSDEEERPTTLTDEFNSLFK